MMSRGEKREGGGGRGSPGWRGNEARTRVISFQEVRNKAGGQRLVTCVCVCF